MRDDDLALRKLNPNVVQLWLEEARDLMYADAVAKHDLEAVEHRTAEFGIYP